MGLDRKEYGGEMGVVLDDVLRVGGLKSADNGVETLLCGLLPLSATTI